MKPFDKKLVLEDGSEYPGYGFGANVERVCEVVFNTSMTGYQELVSDPSYTDQFVVMTYPLIGNYGITDEDFESKTPSIGGLIVRDYNDMPSNFRYTRTLGELLEENNIPGLHGIDTRMLTRSIRDFGARRGIITDIATQTRPSRVLPTPPFRTTRFFVSPAKSDGMPAPRTTASASWPWTAASSLASSGA